MEENKKTTNLSPVVKQVLENRKPEKISVDEFVEKYEKKPTDITKNQYFSSTVRIRKYIPYADKVAISRAIVDQSCINKNNVFKIDTTKKYFLYVVSVFELYTNIFFDKNKIYEQYDKLAENGIIAKVFDSIPENEISEYRTILQMVYDDYISNNCEINAIIRNLFLNVQPKISEVLNMMLKEFSEKIDSLDENKMNEILQSLVK